MVLDILFLMPFHSIMASVRAVGVGVATGWLLVAAAHQQAAQDPPTAAPFEYNLDQSGVCPDGSFDFSLADVDDGMVGPDDDPELAAILGAIPAGLDAKLRQLRCPSASAIVVQGGRTIFSSFRGSARWNVSAPLSDTTGCVLSMPGKFDNRGIFVAN